MELVIFLVPVPCMEISLLASLLVNTTSSTVTFVFDNGARIKSLVNPFTELPIAMLDSATLPFSSKI